MGIFLVDNFVILGLSLFIFFYLVDVYYSCKDIEWKSFYVFENLNW